jgi:hypothetical protein
VRGYDSGETVQIFRYYKAEHALSVLNDLEIRTSIPNQLNDPFELSPKIDPSQFTLEMFETFLRRDFNINEAYELEASVRGLTDREAFKTWYLGEVAGRARRLFPNISNNVEMVRRNFLDHFSKHWRIVCGSLVNDSILMWSHYANKHTGVVLAFDTSKEPFSQLGESDVRRVTYSEKKPYYVHSSDVDCFLKGIFNVASTKAAPWSYEKEVRIVIAANWPLLRETRFLRITPACITGVILGCRASPTTQAAVRSALGRPHFQQIRLLEAHLDPAEYALNLNQSG